MHQVRDEVVILDAVFIHNRHEVIQLVLGGGHGRFPYLAFLCFPVAKKNEDAAGKIVAFGGDRHADPGGQPLAERPGCHVQAGDFAHIRMPLKPGTKLTQGVQLFHGEKAAHGKGGIDNRTAMPLGEDEAVALPPIGLVRPDIHFTEIKRRYNVGCGQRAAGVPGARRVDHGEQVFADCFGLFRQRRDTRGKGVHGDSPGGVFLGLRLTTNRDTWKIPCGRVLSIFFYGIAVVKSL